MPFSICPFDYTFKLTKSFYLFLIFVDLLQGILGLIFYCLLRNSFRISTILIIVQVLFILSGSAIFAVYKQEQSYLNKIHFNYFIFKAVCLFFYFIVFTWNIIELDFFKNDDNDTALIVTLLFFCIVFNVFHFTWHFKMIRVYIEESNKNFENHEIIDKDKKKEAFFNQPEEEYN